MSNLNVNAISPQSGSTLRLTSNLNITGHVTASGNISASGTVFADNFQSTGGDVAGISFNDDFNLTGDMTGSGNLEIAGNVSGSSTSTGSFGHIQTKLTGHAQLGYALVGDWPETSTYAFFGNKDLDQGAVGNYALKQSTNGTTYLNTAAGRDIYFRINNSTKMRLNSSGNLGIANNNPAEKLDVGGNIKASGNISGSATSTGSFGVLKVGPRATAGMAFQVSKGDNDFIKVNSTNALEPILQFGDIEALGNSGIFTIDGANSKYTFTEYNVGISVTNPSQKLHVGGNIFATGNISGSATSTGSFGRLAVGTATIQIPSNGFITMGSLEGMVMNTRFGNNAGQNLQAGGTQNVIVGEDAGANLTTGDTNVAVGSEALKAATGDSNNVAIGRRALHDLNATNARNVAVGTGAGDGITSGTENVLLGHSTNASAVGGDNQIAIGSGVTGTGDNQTVIGNSSQTHVVFGGDALISGSAKSTGSFGRIESSGDLGIDGNIDVKGNVTAQNFIVSSSVTNITYQSLSGSTIFGDTSDDIHRFTGSIRQTSTSTGSFGTIRTGTTIGSLSSGISFGDGDTGIYEKTDDNIIITAGNSLESLKIAPTAVTWRTDSFNINTSTSTFYGIRMSPDNSANTIYLAGSGAQTIDFSKVGVLKTSTTLNAGGAAFSFQGTMDQIGSYSATSQFVTLAPVMSSSNAVATSSYTMLDMAGTIDMTGQTQETIRSLHIHPTKTNIANYTAIDADGDIITTGNVSGSATSTGSFGTINVDFWNKGIGDQTNTYIGHEVGDNLTALNSSPKNTYIGSGAGKNATFKNSRFNTVIGALALDSAVSASSNVIIGSSAAGAWDTTSDNNSNVVIGSDAMPYNAGGIRNIAIGAQVMTYGSAVKTGNDNIAMGQYVLGKATSATGNIGIGQGAILDNIDGNYNVAIGRSSLPNIVSTDYNVAIGERALYALSGSNSHNNVAVGKYAGYHIANGSTSHYGGINSIFIGTDTKALADNETNQIVIGYDAIGKGSNTVVLGDDNITDIYMSEDVGAKLHTGDVSGSATSTGSFGVLKLDKFNGGIGASTNTLYGVDAGSSIDDSVTTETAIGYQALKDNATSGANTAVGAYALWSYDGSTGRNTAVGLKAGWNLTGGYRGTYIGWEAEAGGANNIGEIVIGYAVAGKGSNTAVIGGGNITDIYMSSDVGAKLHTGDVSGSAISTGSFGHVRMNGKDLPPMFVTGSSIFLGGEGTGTGDDGSDNNNVGIGDDVLSAIGTGARNVAIGLKAMENRVAASENVAIGYRAGGPGAQKMGQNTLVGVDAGYSLDGSGGTYNATSNTFIGHQSGDGATAGLKNTAIGDNSARSLVAGSSNVFLGYFSGNGGNTEGGTYIGENTAATDGASNEVVLGKSAVGKGSNTVVLGGDHITDIYMSEDVSATLHTGTVSGSAASTGSFGAVQSAGDITPKVDDNSNLGSAALRFSNVFTTDLQLSNEGKPEGNEVDGTTGSWTIQEGEDDLYLLNRKNGKRYKFKLEEIG